ncbi:50S ribosomal protein L18 [Candidatus Marsarchaeota archaeon]|nr:50S ribosomal protein L18 [Candidatus Marsarchaeota archaeon]
MNRSTKNVKFRRRRESVTNYKKRFSLVKSGLDRIVVRRSNRRIIGQIVRYSPSGDVVLAHADSTELKAFGWPPRSNRPTAYLTGLLLSRKPAKSGGSGYIMDIGLSSPTTNSVPFVFAKGCIDGGMPVKGSIDIDEKVYNYSNASYAAGVKSKDSAMYQRQYSAYIKGGKEPEALGRLFAETKDRIMKSDAKA